VMARPRYVTFDCYGTLIDWESGLKQALAEGHAGRGAGHPDDLGEPQARAPAGGRQARLRGGGPAGGRGRDRGHVMRPVGVRRGSDDSRGDYRGQGCVAAARPVRRRALGRARRHDRRRPASSMTPTLPLSGGRPVGAIGASGGPRILSAILQTLVQRLDFGSPVAEAVAVPRPHWEGGQLLADSGAGDDRMGVCQAILIDLESGEPGGAGDPRAAVPE